MNKKEILTKIIEQHPGILKISDNENYQTHLNNEEFDQFVPVGRALFDVINQDEILYMTSSTSTSADSEVLRNYRISTAEPQITEGEIKWDDNTDLLEVTLEGKPILNHEFSDQMLIGLIEGGIRNTKKITLSGNGEVRIYELSSSTYSMYANKLKS